MSSFEESLKNTIRGLGEEYSRTVQDLVDETNAASDAVNRITNGMAQMTLSTELKASTGTDFALNLKNAKSFSEISGFFVKSNGYPIKVASSVSEARAGLWEEDLYSRDDLKSYYLSLAANPESRLALRLAFLLRQEEDQPERMS